MSPIQPLLIFDLDDTRFGVDATLVRESVWLPELTPVEEAPPYIVGMFSLRDQLVPVTDLNLRFGHPIRPYTLGNQVVVLQQDRLLMGLIVSEVREVIELPSTVIQPAPQFDAENPQKANHLIVGEARVGDDIVTLLDVHKLVSLPQNPAPADMKHPASHFCPEATEEQHAVYRARARALQNTVAEEEDAHLALAVVELGGEYFGIELGAVQEFCEVTRLSPIPCCPPHILGSMSLRGNLLTLLDMSTALNLPQLTRNNGKVVVSRVAASPGTVSGDQIVGVTVDEVHDVIYLRQEELQPAPIVLSEQCGKEIKGAVPYADKMMVVLDLPELLAREEWIVNESV